jgi:hypothetical protein
MKARIPHHTSEHEKARSRITLERAKRFLGSGQPRGEESSLVNGVHVFVSESQVALGFG